MNHGDHHAHDAHAHHHAHAHDRGLSGFLRYARLLPRMWRSEVSTAVVHSINPQRRETVLEIGAGMGAAMVVAARTGAEVIAVDPTPYMRRISRLRRLGLSGSKRISVRDGAAESLPAADGSVDAVWSVNTMHHWPNLEQALGEIARVLRPGGRLLLLDEDFEDPAHPDHERFTKARAKHGHAFTEIDPDAMARTLRKLGFESAEGGIEQVANRPAKVVRGTK